MNSSKGLLPLVDRNNRVIGKAPRSVCHGNPDLMHCSVHVIIIDSKGRLLLQKRSKNKDIQPGKWDTSVGGHLDAGENFFQAAKRETFEELGIEKIKLKHLYDYIWSNRIETESVRTYLGFKDGPISCDKKEVDEVQFWKFSEIRRNLEKKIFTPNFRHEFRLFTATPSFFLIEGLCSSGHPR